MRRASDGQLLAAVLGVPVVISLGIQAFAGILGQPLDAELAAFGCAVIMMTGPALSKFAGQAVVPYGPRSLQNAIGYLGGMWAMLIILHMPEAEVSFGRAALPLLILLLPIALFGFTDIWADLSIANHITALRRHSPALKIIFKDFAVGFGFILLIVGIRAGGENAAPAQVVWAAMVMFGTALCAPQIMTLAVARKMPPMSGLRMFTLALASAVYFAAMMMIYLYVMNFGQDEHGGIALTFIGIIIGAFLPIMIVVMYRWRRKGPAT